MPGHLRLRALAVLLLATGPGACGDTQITVTSEGELEVIEEVTFAPSLGIDLASMTRLESGVYILDIDVGTGDELEYGLYGEFAFTGWLRTGTLFTTGETTFLMGNNEVIPGFEQGVLGMRVGGTRLLVIPPVLAWGTRGSTTVPAGAIVIYEATLKGVSATR